jgi:hypothetical protein
MIVYKARSNIRLVEDTIKIRSHGFLPLKGETGAPAEGEIIALYMPLETIAAAL